MLNYIQGVPKNLLSELASISIRPVWWLGIDHRMLMEANSESAFLEHPVSSFLDSCLHSIQYAAPPLLSTGWWVD